MRVKQGFSASQMLSANVDGASIQRCFFSIYLPLAKPAIINLAVLQIMWSFQDFLFPLMFLTKDKAYTTTGVGTAISQELLMGNSEHYGSMVEKLEPGEEKVVTYPYEICSIWFHKKDWKNIEMRSFWMTFASYPDKIVLYL